MNPTALLLSLITVLAWGAGSICDKAAVGQLSANAVLVLRSLIMAVVFASYGAISGSFREIAAGRALPLAFVVAGALVGPIIGQFTYFRALKIAEASQVIPVCATYPLVALALAILLLREPLTVSKGAGAICIVAGIILISGVGRTA